MTTFDAAAAWQKKKPLGLALCAALLAFGLAGCETYKSLTSSLFSSSSDTPTASVSAPMAPAAVRPAQVAIAPIIGPPEQVSRDLQTQITSDLERQNIRVARSPGEPSQYTLRGYIVSSMEKKGAKAKVSYIWDVTDSSGKGVHRVSGEESAATGKSKDPWTAVSATVVQAISTKTTSSIATWLPTQGVPVASNGMPASGLVQTAAATQTPGPTYASTAPPATASIGKPGSITARVPSVTGAPGDGSTALRSALQRELARSGVALADTPSPSTYTVEGKVAMGTGKDGKQSIIIDWNVADPQGKKLGTVSQKNDIPQGSLDGAWGKTADAAAAAAAQGILKLLPQSQKTSSN